MMMNLPEAEAFLHRKIPITRAMGVRIAAYDEEKIVLQAPLALNHNHLGTAFGGSLGSMAMLAGYALLWLELREYDCHVVVRDCAIDFRHPVRSDLRAVCKRPSTAVLAAFRNAFTRKGKARIKLAVTIDDNAGAAVVFSGTFVAIASEHVVSS